MNFGLVPYPQNSHIGLEGFMHATAIGKIAAETTKGSTTKLTASTETAIPAGIPASGVFASAMQTSSKVAITSSLTKTSATMETAAPSPSSFSS